MDKVIHLEKMKRAVGVKPLSLKRGARGHAVLPNPRGSHIHYHYGIRSQKPK